MVMMDATRREEKRVYLPTRVNVAFLSFFLVGFNRLLLKDRCHGGATCFTPTFFFFDFHFALSLSLSIACLGQWVAMEKRR